MPPFSWGSLLAGISVIIMVSLNRLKHKAKLIGCDVKKVDSCKNKLEVEKLMKVIDDKIKEKLKDDHSHPSK